MVGIKYKITSKNVSTAETLLRLQEIFSPAAVGDELNNHEEKIKAWFEDLLEKIPLETETEKFLGISCNATGYYYKNLGSEVLAKHSLPKFFEFFPNGIIYIIEYDTDFFYRYWQQEKKYNEKFPNGMTIEKTSFEFSGLKEENLLHYLVDQLSYLFYPYYLYELESAAFGYYLLYFPGVPTFCEQLNNQNDVYKHVILKMHHCFDDQWTFEGSRGPKSNLANFDLLIDKFEAILIEQLKLTSNVILQLQCIKHNDTQKQLFFTLNSMILDLFYICTSQAPYLTKTFLFQVLDKAANILRKIKFTDLSETTIWLKFFNRNFIENELKSVLDRKYSDTQREIFNWIPDMVIDEMIFSDFSEDLLRDIRNSGHGFLFNEKKYERMSGNDLEINNDISYYALSVFHYLLIQIAYELELEEITA